MGATGSLVHESCANTPAGIPLIHFFLNGFIGIHGVFAQPLDIYLSIIFPDFQSFLVFTSDEQILNFLIVNFQHTELNLISNIRIGV